MTYRLPNLEDKNILIDYVAEHYANGEKSISASNGLTTMEFTKWVNKINRNKEIADDEWGKYYLYLVFNDENKLIGLLNIRYDLSNKLRQLYGDIGYGVRPSERRKGYATEILRYAKKVCREMNINNIILGCYENNFGSNKTIIKNGGILYKSDEEEKVISDTWKINLKRNYYNINLKWK